MINLTDEKRNKITRDILNFLSHTDACDLYTSWRGVENYVKRWSMIKTNLMETFKFDPETFRIEIPISDIAEVDHSDIIDQINNYRDNRIDTFMGTWIDNYLKDLDKTMHYGDKFQVISFYTDFCRGIVNNSRRLNAALNNIGFDLDSGRNSDMKELAISLIGGLRYFQGLENINSKNARSTDNLDVKEVFNLHEIIKDEILEKMNTTPKLTKQLSKLASFFPNPLIKFVIEQIIITISFIIGLEPKKISENSNLVLSIHPLDYLTMSYNDYSWDSCTRPGGDHFGTTFSAMGDAVTMVVFLESTKSKIKFGDSCWNNKKLRFLVHFDDVDSHAIVCNKMYPYYCFSIQDLVIRELNKRADMDWTHASAMPFIHDYFVDPVSANPLEEYGFYWDEYQQGVYFSKKIYEGKKEFLLQYNFLLNERSNTDKMIDVVAEEKGFDLDTIRSEISSFETQLDIGHPLTCLDCSDLSWDVLQCPSCMRIEEECVGNCEHCSIRCVDSQA